MKSTTTYLTQSTISIHLHERGYSRPDVYRKAVNVSKVVNLFFFHELGQSFPHKMNLNPHMLSE